MPKYAVGLPFKYKIIEAATPEEAMQSCYNSLKWYKDFYADEIKDNIPDTGKERT